MKSFKTYFQHTVSIRYEFSVILWRHDRSPLICSERSVTLLKSLTIMMPFYCTLNHFTKSTIWDITPCISLKLNRRFGEIYLLNVQGRISRKRHQRESRRQAEWLAQLIRLWKWKAIYSSETSVDFQRTTRRCIPEGSTHHNHFCENPKILLYRD
jgi:hypothetical protein